MFKKLRNQLLLFNIGILSILMFIVFSVLYLSVYSDVNNRIEVELDRLLSMPINNDTFPENGGVPQVPENIDFVGSFVLLVDNGIVVGSSIQNDIENTLVIQAFDNVDSSEGKFDLDNNTWGYKVLSINPTESKIAFVNMTRDQDLLQSSITRYIILFVGAIGATALISTFLTSKSIKPIKESFEKQKEFVANASHELKTPLTVINTNIDVLLSNGENENTKWLKYIKTEVLRMNKLTHDLLYLANVDEENQLLVNTFDASTALESVLLGVEALCFEKELKLTYTLEQKSMIKFNEEQFIQLAMILIDNAIKYTPKKGTIKLDLAKANKNTVISIENSGIGISEVDLPYVFDRFYKSDKSRKNSNNSFGLGLSIAKAIIENHHGKITVESEPNEYTRFTITI